MASVAERPKADTSITMRLPVQTRDLIDRAAATIDKSRTEFVLESARQRAIDVLLDQRVFHLDAEASDALADVLENPPAPVDALRKLMASKSPWE
ncbi:DUF1778 domain-containing protein [Sphingomonas sp. NIBR02145]|uniref:type II toxin-antitoxin system TacA family antitoxin n=1 Tax=Sphingomonas sp. NIBR02145 TaxID=3014784 RepID=UPI0022B411B6|nr:DUF1778 domain-containing protein [Sphingomonas sp. NIBR02145]WHU02491.1 DUF1778 domain-containing protein [Sphingomonas sp. NIBR02145]